MRVESDIHTSGQPAPPPINPWPQSLISDPTRPDHPWPQQDPSISTPNHHQSTQDMSSHHPSYSLQVDPALNPPQHRDEQVLDDSFLLQPTYPVPRAKKPRTDSNTDSSSRRPPSSRARTDMLSPNAAALFRAATAQRGLSLNEVLVNDNNIGNGPPSPTSPSSPSSGNGVPRLPPIMQVEKQTVTTTATQAASASRRRNEAMYQCPVPGCGSTFTRRFNLRGHLRSHTEERPYICDWPGCGKGFARQHDCKRHYALHSPRPQSSHACQGCGKSFSRTDALNRHLRSENGADCRAITAANNTGGVQQTLNPHLLMHLPDPNGLPGQGPGPSFHKPNGNPSRTSSISATPSRSRSPL